MGIRAHSLPKGPDIQNITLGGMRGGLQGTALLPTAVGVAGLARSKIMSD